MSTNKPRSFSVIGCGRVGICLAVFLRSRGFAPVAFFSRSRSSADHAAKMAGKGRAVAHALSAVRGADIVFLTPPDTEIQPLCNALADGKGFSPGTTVFHLSGALSSDILASAGAQGAEIGSIHPLQAFAPYEAGQANPFEGINMSVEGSPGAQALGKEIVKVLGAQAFTIPTRSKTLYHASAVVASNYLVTLEHFALELLMETGLNEEKAFDILEPLIRGTLANIKARGSAAALTGPVARGDHEIVSAHLKDLDEIRPEFSALYRLLGQHTLDIAGNQGLEGTAAEKLSRLFTEGH
jgi:predicted short-subunit dehydrogenase-like oxidoreductase (DUF2520 family)